MSHRRMVTWLGQTTNLRSILLWNTDQYQGFDLADGDSEGTVNAVTKTTTPHQYGFTTQEKHRLKMDDGDPKCNYHFLSE